VKWSPEFLSPGFLYPGADFFPLSWASYAFGQLIMEDRFGYWGGGLFWLLALIMEREQRGHVAHPLVSLEKEWETLWDLSPPLGELIKEDPKVPEFFPSKVKGTSSSHGGLLLEENQVYYFEKSFLFEQNLVEGLIRCFGLSYDPLSSQSWKDFWEGQKGQELHPLQKRAVEKSLKGGFFLLSGGPGTGKTTTLRLIVQAWKELRGLKDHEIALVAPTGRGAQRMGVSLDWKDLRAMTLHRLLGIREFEHQGIHFNSGRKLPEKLIVVDEASMLDLRLFGLLVEALGKQGTLILMGDKDQLPSVDNGAVLGDILQALKGREKGEEYYEVLTHCFRAQGTLVTLSRKMVGFQEEEEEGARAWGPLEIFEELEKGGGDQGLRWAGDLIFPNNQAQLALWARELGFESLRDLGEKNWGEGEALSESLEKGVILSLTRKGLWGTKHMNLQLAKILGFGSAFPGMPLLVTRNDSSLDLFNGDRGLIVRKAGGGEYWVAFPQPGGQIRTLPLSLVASWEPGWCMSIHKSQGSEFDRVVLVLETQKTENLSREVLYTGVTRGRKSSVIYGEKEKVLWALEQKSKRDSRITQLLEERLIQIL